MKLKIIASVSLVWMLGTTGYAQILRLEDALQYSADRYDKIKSKQQLVAAAEQQTAYQKQQYLPDVTLAAQQSFGTVNMLHGPMYAYGGMASGATSMPLAEQNWNAAFGSLYFANVNWNVFTFGKIKNQVILGIKKEHTAKADLAQEIFQHQVKVSAAYLNLLASQRIRYVQEKNLDRAQVFYEMTDARARSGLIAEVDAQLARAEVSNAKSLQIKSHDRELEFSKQLAVLLDEPFQTYRLDSLYNTSIPRKTTTGADIQQHPLLQHQQRKIDEGQQKGMLLQVNRLPSVSAFGVLQGRGSGFSPNYAQDLSAYSAGYFKGVGIQRSNYLLGFSLSWNLTNVLRFNTSIREQKFLTRSLQKEFDGYKKELQAQAELASSQIINAYDNFGETQVQLTAAEMAYRQHTSLYENGLTTLVDYTQALYSLNRAEIEYEIAQNNVWQALLLLASAKGDLGIFIQHN
ncbi:TolC family protein [Chitinophaga caseinilytica]|uniref:TolC family protein n=1 Tax=Chitinophaga caseinilytica TaxID=2267521 RepID=UPI003C2F60B2